MNKRNGIAIVVVLFFAFIISFLLFFMTSSNSNLSIQNKKSLREMQAYYLAQSAMQNAKLQIKLLPKETYDFFHKHGTGNPYMYVDSSSYPPLAMNTTKKKMRKYDLFKPGASLRTDTPYPGAYRVDSIKLMGSHKNMKMIQDAYKITVSADIGIVPKTAHKTLTEEVTVSRFTGGIN